MVRALDRSVGRIMDKLEEEGLSDNTVIVFTSDNGGAGYIGLPEVNAPYQGLEDHPVRGRHPSADVCFLAWQIAADSTIETPVAHVDLMPTLAAIAGAVLPAGVEIDGENLLPEATGAGTLNGRMMRSSGPAAITVSYALGTGSCR
jgi:arylsulfatase A-like enzyme